MGQYHLVCNLDKKEFLSPDKLGVGSKAWEQMASYGGTTAALFALLICSRERGGGDLGHDDAVGRWAGNRVAIVGDYAEDEDLAIEHKASEIYHLCIGGQGGWVDISKLILPVLLRELGGKVTRKRGFTEIEYNLGG